MSSSSSQLLPERKSWPAEILRVFRLALPIICAEIGWVAMNIVDTMMVGRLGPTAIGAVSLGSNLFLGVAIFGIGLLLSLDFYVARSFGSGDREACREWLIQGVYLSLFLTPFLTLATWIPIPYLDDFGSDPAVLDQAIPYLEILSLSILPLLLYSSFRRYLQGLSKASYVMFALVSANVVNVLVNWLLIFGNLGAPALGAVGAGWATLASRLYMAGFLWCCILWEDRRRSTRRKPADPLWKLRWSRLYDLIRLGLPAAGQVTLEVGVFALATVFASRVGVLPLAAHQIALAVAGFTFMIPLGISSAAAVLVAQALGRDEAEHAARTGWAAIVLGGIFMSAAMLTLLLFPETILRLFTPDSGVISLGVPLMMIAGAFQVFDGLQVVTTGTLRGRGDTRTPVLTCLVCHWFLGLPAGYLLCFSLAWGVIGLWIGLSLGLIVVSLILLWVWTRQLGKEAFAQVH